jgi:urease accessory protein
MTPIARLAAPALSLAFVFAASPAFAHHLMGGVLPATLAQGLLSGLAHPVIGLDHLAALIGVGLLASRFSGAALAMPVMWLIGMGAGAYAHMRGIDLPGGEIAVAGSLILIGAAGMLRPSLPVAVVLALFAIGGFTHGYALAESIIGAEPTPLAAYLVGLVAVQTVITVAVTYGALRWVGKTGETPLPLRAMAGLAGLVGVVFLATALPGLA